ncbi:hypothetical protein BC629DRAFT_237337 [Irpex lacteus]|nr:hypothetical protein BC629DRAFT_237337 [Irpex lacteus]
MTKRDDDVASSRLITPAYKPHKKGASSLPICSKSLLLPLAIAASIHCSATHTSSPALAITLCATSRARPKPTTKVFTSATRISAHISTHTLISLNTQNDATYAYALLWHSDCAFDGASQGSTLLHYQRAALILLQGLDNHQEAQRHHTNVGLYSAFSNPLHQPGSK